MPILKAVLSFIGGVLEAILPSFISYKYGKDKQDKTQIEANNKELEKDAEIDAQCDSSPNDVIDWVQHRSE